MREKLLPGIQKIIEAERIARATIPPECPVDPSRRAIDLRGHLGYLEDLPEVQLMHRTGRVPRFLRRLKSDSY